MTLRTQRFSFAFVGAMLAALSGCRSSDDAELPSVVPDAQVAPDTGDGQSAADIAAPIDEAAFLDAGSTLDAVDTGTLPYDAARDRYSFTTTDGRQMTMVDYCLPILPLSSNRGGCAADLDEAIVAAQATRDASAPSLGRCSEGWVYYFPQGWTLGWASTCYYDTQSRQLVSVTSGTDTPTECTRSPEPNTAAFNAEVYGRLVTCSYVPTTGGFDASAVD